MSSMLTSNSLSSLLENLISRQTQQLANPDAARTVSCLLDQSFRAHSHLELSIKMIFFFALMTAWRHVFTALAYKWAKKKAFRDYPYEKPAFLQRLSENKEQSWKLQSLRQVFVSSRKDGTRNANKTITTANANDKSGGGDSMFVTVF